MSAAALISALDCASDHAERAALIARASPEQLKQLHAALVYRQMCAEVVEQLAAESAAFRAFEDQLAAAEDDAARLQIIEAAQNEPQRGPAFVSEWHWQRGADLAAWLGRYVALLSGNVPP